MPKNKLKNPTLIAGGMAVLGLVAGIATMASAQTASTSPKAPTAVMSASTTTSAVDTPESANDPADTEKIQADPGHQDQDSSAASEASEPAGSSDTSEQ